MNLLKIESWKVQEWMLLLLSVSIAHHYYRYCMLRPPRSIRGIKEHETEKILGLILKFHSYPFCFNKCYKKLTTWTLNRHKSLTQSTSHPPPLYYLCRRLLFSDVYVVFVYEGTMQPHTLLIVPAICFLLLMMLFVSTATASAPGRAEREGSGAGAGQRWAALPRGRGPQPQGKGWTDFMAILPNNLHFHMHYSVIWGQKQWLWGAVLGEQLWSCCYSI